MARRVSQISAHETVAIPNDLTDEQFEGEFVILIPLHQRLLYVKNVPSSIAL